MKDILLVSDNQELIHSLETIVTFLGESCQSRGFHECEDYLQDSGADAVLIDYTLPSAVKALIARFPHIPFVVLQKQNGETTAECNLVSVVTLPLTYPVLTQAIHRCQEYSRRKPGNTRSGGAKTRLFRSLVGQSDQIQIVRRLVEQVAPTEATVLILGESGTGKEVVARNVHFLSERKDGPFIPVNCGAIPGELLESELFGHEKGAFTGATALRRGRFEQADGGTLFLDEIGDMPAETQTRLLRVLADGEFYRVGGLTAVKADVRIIAATHQNLEKLVEAHQFREDLFHRLNVIRINLPRLSERREDIPQLMRHFFEQAATELNVDTKILRPETEEYLCRMNWPGNVRQLQNTCRWLTVMASGQEVLPSDLPPEIHSDSSIEKPSAESGEWPDLLASWTDKQLRDGHHNILNDAMLTFERIMLERALQHTHGHKQDAAKRLGWGRNTLTRKLKELGVN